MEHLPQHSETRMYWFNKFIWQAEIVNILGWHSRGAGLVLVKLLAYSCWIKVWAVLRLILYLYQTKSVDRFDVILTLSCHLATWKSSFCSTSFCTLLYWSTDQYNNEIYWGEIQAMMLFAAQWSLLCQKRFNLVNRKDKSYLSSFCTIELLSYMYLRTFWILHWLHITSKNKHKLAHIPIKPVSNIIWELSSKPVLETGVNLSCLSKHKN